MKIVDATRTVCPRCGQAFQCGVNDDQPCWCSRVALSAATLAELEKRYRGCLCGSCLAALHDSAGSSAPPTQADRPTTA